MSALCTTCGMTQSQAVHIGCRGLCIFIDDSPAAEPPKQTGYDPDWQYRPSRLDPWPSRDLELPPPAGFVPREAYDAVLAERDEARAAKGAFMAEAGRQMQRASEATLKAAYATADLAALRAAIREATEPDAICDAIIDVHDIDAGIDDYARAVSRDLREKLLGAEG